MNRRCYVRAASQVSCQAPLSEGWLDSPIFCEEGYLRALEPDTKGLISPGESRRMSRILKRGVGTSLNALAKAGIGMPDAVITATGTGCMENSERFLTDLCRNGESCLKPTLFMQSTHNTIGSQIAIILKCHGYNTTYSHGALSFGSALLDAWLQIRGVQAQNALVGSHDEVTPLMARILRHTHPEYNLISEASVASVLSSAPDGMEPIELTDVFISNNLSAAEIASRLGGEDSVILTGINGNPLNDPAYEDVIKRLDHNAVILKYKHIFGENFSSPAIAFYVATTLLRRNTIPGFMREEGSHYNGEGLDGVTLLHHSGDSAWSIIRLKKS